MFGGVEYKNKCKEIIKEKIYQYRGIDNANSD
jgi:hypothetical protein